MKTLYSALSISLILATYTSRAESYKPTEPILALARQAVIDVHPEVPQDLLVLIRASWCPRDTNITANGWAPRIDGGGSEFFVRAYTNDLATIFFAEKTRLLRSDTEGNIWACKVYSVEVLCDNQSPLSASVKSQTYGVVITNSLPRAKDEKYYSLNLVNVPFGQIASFASELGIDTSGILTLEGRTFSILSEGRITRSQIGDIISLLRDDIDQIVPQQSGGAYFEPAAGSKSAHP